jgi:hypothetical protein
MKSISSLSRLKILSHSHQVWYDNSMMFNSALIFAYRDEALLDDLVRLLLLGFNRLHIIFAAGTRHTSTWMADPRISTSVIGFGNIDATPLMTRDTFVARFGHDLDVARLMALNFFLNDLPSRPVSPELNDPDWGHYQLMRAIYAMAHSAIVDRVPDLVVVPHGVDPWTRAVAEACAKTGARTMFWESPFLPGHVLLDAKAPWFQLEETEFLCGLRGWSPSPAGLEAAEVLRLSLCQAGITKHPGHSVNNPLASTKQTILIAGQLSGDANVYLHLGSQVSILDWWRQVALSVPTDARVLFKPHPKDTAAGHASVISSFADLPNVEVAEPGWDAAAAIDISDVVVAFTSNLGLDALLRGKPVIAHHRAPYALAGLSAEFDPASRFDDLVIQAKERAAPLAINRYLSYLIHRYMIMHGDSVGLRAKLARCPPESWPGDAYIRTAEPARLQAFVAGLADAISFNRI